MGDIGKRENDKVGGGKHAEENVKVNTVATVAFCGVRSMTTYQEILIAICNFFFIKYLFTPF